MMGLIALALKFGVPPKFAKAAVIAALFALVIAFFALGKCAYDKSIISRHEVKQEAATAKADRKADTHAAEQRRADDSRLTQEADQLKKVQDNAKTDTDRRLARHRCIRLQQAARRDSKLAPACN